jgi:hypothetical protein
MTRMIFEQGAALCARIAENNFLFDPAKTRLA